MSQLCVRLSLLVIFLGGCASRLPPDSLSSVSATTETSPVSSGGDAADDPAIWVNAVWPEASMILGTDKQAALHVYDLEGGEIQRFDVAVNNVDVRQDIRFGDKVYDLAVASLAKVHGFAVWQIDRDSGRLSTLAQFAMPERGDHSYGLCAGLLDDRLFIFLTDWEGHIEQWELTASGANAVADGPLQLEARLAASFVLPTQTEGCVVDDTENVVYFSEESEGVWRFPASPDVIGEGELVARVGENGLAEDVEGLALVRAADGSTQLFVSSQGNNRYLIYEIDEELTFSAVFEITDGDVDATTETDGIEAYGGYLGATYPDGVMVVQDGYNTGPDAQQNFKLVDLRSIRLRVEQSVK